MLFISQIQNTHIHVHTTSTHIHVHTTPTHIQVDQSVFLWTPIATKSVRFHCKNLCSLGLNVNPAVLDGWMVE